LNSNEYTYKYDRHSFHSNDEDVIMDNILATLEVLMEFDMKGFSDEEPLPKPNNNKEGMDDKQAKEVDKVSQELGFERSDSESNSKEEKQMLITKIESATLALSARRK